VIGKSLPDSYSIFIANLGTIVGTNPSDNSGNISLSRT
jgi:hypothetical protein